MGEMLVLLGASDVCFMGGSLVGKKVGGHNLLEPASLAKPIITGPSFYNFTDIAHALINAHACVIADQPETIAKQVNHWFLMLKNGSNAEKCLSDCDAKSWSSRKHLDRIRFY